MKFTEAFEFETTFGKRRTSHEARVTYTVTPGRRHPVMRGLRQTYGQTAEAPEVDDMDFEINLYGTWHKASDDLHDFLLIVIGDNMEWLIESAREQAHEATA